MISFETYVSDSILIGILSQWFDNGQGSEPLVVNVHQRLRVKKLQKQSKSKPRGKLGGQDTNR